MGTPKEHESSQQFALEDAFIDHAFELREQLEDTYAIPMASTVSIDDLVKIGAAAYAGDQVAMGIREGYVTGNVAQVDPEFFTELRTTPEEFTAKYKELIGERNYTEGQIAQFLTTSQGISTEDADDLRKRFAGLMAYQFALNPEILIQRPGIGLDYDTTSGLILRDRAGDELYTFSDRPSVVVEYGPGLVAHRRIPDEVKHSPPITVMIDDNPYVNEVLLARTRIAGLNQDKARPHLSTLTAGIKAGSDWLVSRSAQADLVIASMIQTAGAEEIQAGFHNASRLLRPGGLLVVQALDEVKAPHPSGEHIVRMASQSFAKSPEKRTNFTMQTVTGQKAGFNALFRK